MPAAVGAPAPVVPPAPKLVSDRTLADADADLVLSGVLAVYRRCLVEINEKSLSQMSDYAHFYECTKCSKVFSHFGKEHHLKYCLSGADSESCFRSLSENDYQNKVMRGVDAGLTGPFISELQTFLKKFHDDAKQLVDSFPVEETGVTYYLCNKCNRYLTYYLVAEHSALCHQRHLASKPQFTTVTEEEYNDGVSKGRFIPDKIEAERRRQHEEDLMTVEDELSRALNRKNNKCCSIV